MPPVENDNTLRRKTQRLCQFVSTKSSLLIWSRCVPHPDVPRELRSMLVSAYSEGERCDVPSLRSVLSPTTRRAQLWKQCALDRPTTCLLELHIVRGLATDIQLILVQYVWLSWLQAPRRVPPSIRSIRQRIQTLAHYLLSVVYSNYLLNDSIMRGN